MDLSSFMLSIFSSCTDSYHCLINNPLHSSCMLFLTLIFLVVTYFALFHRRQLPIYLVDFACFRPPLRNRIPYAAFIEHTQLIAKTESAAFMVRILERSGMGEETSLPVSCSYIPPVPTHRGAEEEAELVIFTAIEEALRKTSPGIDVRDVNVLIVNCNSFFPMPSLTARVINRYKLRTDIRSYNLSGMGCSCGPISVGLARDLLKVHPDSVALIVSTEIITSPSWYTGNERAMLIPNCLFRLGAAAILLSNRPRDSRLAKYKLLHVVRTHTGADDRAYGCLYQQEDHEGKLGIALSKEVMALSSIALRQNLNTLGRLVLPYWQQLLYLYSVAAKWKCPYIPKFGKVFDHICIHAGGRAVIEEVQKNLGLSEEQVEASRMTLHRFGNTSSSSVWYELGYWEAKGKVKKGEKVWQLGLGSGFKCNSAVWECMRSVGKEMEGAWSQCIDRYPVQVPDTIKLI